MTERRWPSAAGSGDENETNVLPTVNPTRGEARSASAQGSLVHGSAARPSAAASSRGGSDSGSSTSGVAGKVTEAATSALGAAASATAGARQAFREAADRAEAQARPTRSAGRRPPRRAKLTLSHINVYSVFKLACVLAIALFLVWMFAVGVLYGVLDLTGILDRVNSAATTISGDASTAPTIGGGLVFGIAIIIGALNIVLFIAMSTIGAMVYNLCADLVGGIEVTLAERE
jgi:hypothetical protein